MKTLDEIKKGLGCCTSGVCANRGCPYYDQFEVGACVEELMVNALYSIRDLEAAHRTEYCENADYDCVKLGKARQRIAQLEAERLELLDVIDGTIANNCYICKHAGHEEDAGICAACVDAGSREFFEWRGKA